MWLGGLERERHSGYALYMSRLSLTHSHQLKGLNTAAIILRPAGIMGNDDESFRLSEICVRLSRCAKSDVSYKG